MSGRHAVRTGGPAHRARRAPRPRLRRLLVVAVAASLSLAVGAVAASASTLGGLTTSGLGAVGTTAVGGPEQVQLQLVPKLTAGQWALDRLVVTAGTGTLAAGDQVRVALLAANGSALCQLSATASAGSASISAAAVTTACGSALPIGDIRGTAVSVTGANA